MLTPREILLGVLLPLGLALLLGGLAAWRRWTWLLILAAGAGFLAGYASSLSPSGGFALPMLPPSDGTDWLFWCAIPAIALAMVLGALRQGPRHPSWLALLGLWPGVGVYAILRPLMPHALTLMSATVTAATAAFLGAITLWLQIRFAHRVGHRWLAAALAAALGASGAAILSCNLLTAGVYGLGAGAALLGVCLSASRTRCAPALALLSVSILYGLLAAGHFYPEPGLPLTATLVLACLPALGIASALLPVSRPWLRGALALLAVALVAAAVAAPLALAAKHAAETDPYSEYK